jgi:hypothetical protein
MSSSVSEMTWLALVRTLAELGTSLIHHGATGSIQTI